jgi:HTH-type transcriptional regulator, osmoprotectant uptake regulator
MKLHEDVPSGSGAVAPAECARTTDPRIGEARHELLTGLATELPNLFPEVTRIGGQVVAALHLAEGPRSMDELSAELGCSKSNIFANVRGLEAAGIIERRRGAGARHDSYTLRAKYPDVIISAYISRLRRLAHDKQALCRRVLGLLGDAQGVEADDLRARLASLSRQYELVVVLMDAVGPVELEPLITRVLAGAELGDDRRAPRRGEARVRSRK